MLSLGLVLTLLLSAGMSEAHDLRTDDDAEQDVPTQGVGRETQEKALETLHQVFGVGGVGSSPGPQVPPQFMTELYKTIADPSGVTRGRNPYNAKVVRSFIERDNSHTQFFYFNISGLEVAEKVLEAELHLYRRRLAPPPSAAAAPYYLLRVFQVLNESRLDNPDYQRPLNVHYVSAHASGWEVFNVKMAVLDWVSGKSANRGLLVTATNIFGDPVEVRFARRDAHHNSKQPILVLFDDDGRVQPSVAEATPSPNPLANYPNYYKYQSDDSSDGNDVQDSPEHRQRRSTHAQVTSFNSSTSSECARRHLYVEFEKIGWASWIISPKGYTAYYCQGQCEFPLGQGQRPTNHATVQSIVHELRLDKAVGQPCCVPSTLLPVSILYYDDNFNVVLRMYEDMVVDSCGCH